jgi:methionine synthase I (cobalamin-dependent)
MQPYIANLSKCADCYVFAYPNAGLPNAMGGYDQKVRHMTPQAEVAQCLADQAAIVSGRITRNAPPAEA